MLLETPSVNHLVTGTETLLHDLAHISDGCISVYDRHDNLIKEFGKTTDHKTTETVLPIHIEAEPVGTVRVKAKGAEDVAKMVMKLLDIAYRRFQMASVYRATTTDNYEQLVDNNRKLQELTLSLEEQVRVRTRELDEAHTRLAREEKVAAISRLAAGVAHELNTPLACVRSNLQVLLETIPDKGEIMQILRESKEMTDRAAEIVRDLSGFSHMFDQGKTELDLNVEIDRVLRRIEFPKGILIEKDYGALPRTTGDGQHLGLALLHLLENASDAVQNQGRIRITTLVEDNFVVILIHDSGPGIPPEIMGKVFDPFFTTKDVNKGKGLGLTVARDVILAHGGTLALECPPNNGTIARLRIPLAKQEVNKI